MANILEFAGTQLQQAFLLLILFFIVFINLTHRHKICFFV